MLCTPKPNGFADHYPYEKWLFHWEYTQHFQTNPYVWHLQPSQVDSAIFSPALGMPWPIGPPCAAAISAGTAELGGSWTGIEGDDSHN